MSHFTKSLAIVIVVCLMTGTGATAQDSLPASSDSANQSHARLNNVGYTVLDLALPGSDDPLTVAVWYPTDAVPSQHNYGGNNNGMVALDAHISTRSEQYPLLVFSHGYAGGGLGALFLGEDLASRGWIVVAPDHHDEHSSVRIRTGQNKDIDGMGLLRYVREIARSTPADRHKYLYRPKEMQAALTGILSAQQFGPRIDTNRIALGGHSFGGYTALALGGTLPEWHDPRVKALLLFSTGAGGYLFDDEEYRRLDIPTFLWLGEEEAEDTRGEQTMSALSQGMFTNFPIPKYFAELRDGTHTSFNNGFPGSSSGTRFSGSEREFATISRYSIAFLERHILDQQAADEILLRQSAGLSDYQFETLNAQSPDRDGAQPPTTEAEQTRRERWQERRQERQEERQEERRERWRRN